MDLLSNLDANHWVNADPNEKTEFAVYRIAKSTKEEPYGQYSYAVFDDYGNLRKVLLNDADNTWDPLHGINNIELRISEDSVILGICVEDDCVLSKSVVESNSQNNNGVLEDDTVKTSSTTDNLNEDVLDNTASSKDLNKVIMASEVPNQDVISFSVHGNAT